MDRVKKENDNMQIELRYIYLDYFFFFSSLDIINWIYKNIHENNNNNKIINGMRKIKQAFER